MSTRSFSDSLATRTRTPLWLGLVGCSGSGKTFSALRLAKGMQRVAGGEVFGLDSESRRMLHYADRFTFRHVPFTAPFSPNDYLQAIEYCIARGAKTIVIDSMSHVWEGAGGVLEMHEDAVARMSKGNEEKAERVKMAAWIEPKKQHRRMINAMLQLDANFILAFRAKDKMRIVRGETPKHRGFQPIASDDIVFELTAKCLLMPGANGVPTWNPEHDDEKTLVKLPEQFRPLFAGSAGEPLSEDTGEKLARWAAGEAIASPSTGNGNGNGYRRQALLTSIGQEIKRLAGGGDENKAARGVLIKEIAGGNWRDVERLGDPQLKEWATRLRERGRDPGADDDIPPDVSREQAAAETALGAQP